MENKRKKIKWICLAVSVVATLAIVIMTLLFSRNDHFIFALYAPALIVLGLSWMGLYWGQNRSYAIRQMVIFCVLSILAIVAEFVK